METGKAGYKVQSHQVAEWWQPLATLSCAANNTQRLTWIEPAKLCMSRLESTPSELAAELAENY